MEAINARNAKIKENTMFDFLRGSKMSGQSQMSPIYSDDKEEMSFLQNSINKTEMNENSNFRITNSSRSYRHNQSSNAYYSLNASESMASIKFSKRDHYAK